MTDLLKMSCTTDEGLLRNAVAPQKYWDYVFPGCSSAADTTVADVVKAGRANAEYLIKKWLKIEELTASLLADCVDRQLSLDALTDETVQEGCGKFFVRCDHCKHAVRLSPERSPEYCGLFEPEVLRCYKHDGCPIFSDQLQRRAFTLLSTERNAGKVDTLERQLNAIRSHITFLHHTLDQTEPKPIFAKWRDPTWANHRGQDVACFLSLNDGQHDTSKQHAVIYVAAHGYVNSFDKHKVYVRCEVRPGYYPDHDFAFSPDSGTIMLPQDFRYFKSHPHYFYYWLSTQYYTDTCRRLMEAARHHNSNA